MSDINTQHGKFTDLEDDNGNVIKTAQNVYQEWLAQQNSTPITTMTNDEITDYLADVDCRLVMLELGL